jgi:hypothetical protein
MRNVVIVLALLLCSARNASAVEFQDADLKPLLRVNFSLFLAPTTTPIVLAGHIDGIKIITNGGGLISVDTDQGVFGPFRNRLILRGVGSPASLAKLRAEFGKNRIGFQVSCALEPNGDVSGPYEITWYGRGGRRNAFTVLYGKAGAGFPACSAEVQEIVNAIAEFEGTVFLDPDSEKLSSD